MIEKVGNALKKYKYSTCYRCDEFSGDVEFFLDIIFGFFI